MTTAAPPLVGIPASSFYVTGGTLRQDSASYVTRQADTDLYNHLSAGEYCYVLNSRQMGKSSLMIRTSQRLKLEGHTVAVLDLTAIGQNLTPEQWYDGLLNRLGRQLDIEDELDDFYLDNERLSPLQRFFTAIEQIALPIVRKQLIVFVDEIDVVRSLPFSADEFFAAIRQCYVERASNPAYNRLTFCLLGTATPADLVKDTRVSPFNIGKRIEVRDFTGVEAAPLAEGLGANGKALLSRVLCWTGGHPYLTQRLCSSAAEEKANTAEQVDHLCTELFLTHKAKETDDNLMFVRNRLLNNEMDLAALLDLYAHVRQGRRVPDDASNPLTDILKLSGVVRLENGFLRVRNRIYGEVFDRTWIVAHMPDAELRRQRAAYQNGLMRALALSSVVVFIVSLLAISASRSAQEAQAQAERADKATKAEADKAHQNAQLAQQRENALKDALKQKQFANQSAQEAKRQKFLAEQNANNARQAERLARHNATNAEVAGRLAQRNAEAKIKEAQRANRIEKAKIQTERLFAASQTDATYLLFTGQAQTALQQGNNLDAQSYLAHCLPPQNTRDPRGFEWRYLMRECRNTNQSTLPGHQNSVSAVAFSPDGSQIASTETGGNVCIWDAFTGKQTSVLPNLYPQRSLLYLRNSHILVIGAAGCVRFWNTQTGKEQLPSLLSTDKQGHPLNVTALALSSDEKMLACGLSNGSIDLWNIITSRLIKRLYYYSDNERDSPHVPINDLAFSPDGKMLARGCGDDIGNNSVKLWNLPTFTEAAVFTYKPVGDNYWGHMGSIAFSPEGKFLITGGDQVVRMWDLATKQSAELARHGGSITRVIFSPDRHWLATCSEDTTTQLFDVREIDSGRLPSHAGTLRGHTKGVEGVAFSPDSQTLISCSQDKTIKCWNINSCLQPVLQVRKLNRVGPLCYSSDGKLLAAGGYREDEQLDGKQVRIWDAQTRQFITATPPHVHKYDHSLYAAFAPNGKTIAVGAADRTLKLCDTHTGQEVTTFTGTQSPFNVLAFSPDGKWIATGDTDYVGTANGYVVRLWDVASRREIKEFAQKQKHGHYGWVLALAFSPDSKTLVSGGDHGELRWWDVTKQKELESPLLDTSEHTFGSNFVHKRDITSLAFSPDGGFLAVGSEDNSASLWKTKEHKLVRFLLGDQGGVTSVAFAPDGKTLATAGRKGTVKLWSLVPTTLKKNLLLDTVTLNGGHEGIRTLTFSPDGNTLATGHFDGYVLFWQADKLLLGSKR